MQNDNNPARSDSDRRIRLILGCGYVGSRIARLWLDQGDIVFAVTRSPARAGELRDLGIKPILSNWLEPFQLPVPFQTPPASILIAVSHASLPGIPSEETHTRGLGHLLTWLGPIASLSQWIYLSTTGVFASDAPVSDSPVVDETSSVRPTRPGSIAALAGERWMMASQLPHVILRPAGIYGPGRIPTIRPIRSGDPIDADPDSFLNLIHVDDLAAIIRSVSNRTPPHSLYCVSDGNSVRRGDYYSFIASMMGWPPPRYLDPSNPSTRRSQGNKRVSIQRLLQDIHPSFQYPDYRAGLRSLQKELLSCAEPQ